MGLESIFLQNDKKKKKDNLSSRVAYLIKFIDKKQLNVRDKIKYAYTIRSKFVHGDCIGSKDEEKLKKIW